MLNRPINWIFYFIEEMNLLLFSRDWREAFKKEKSWHNYKGGGSSPYWGA